MIADPRKQRIAIGVFKIAGDLARTIEKLETAGSNRAGMTVIAATDSARRVTELGLLALAPAHLAALAPMLSPQAAMDLGRAVAGGDIVLVVPIGDMQTEQAVCRLLLETPALCVQLHDAGP